MAKAKLNLGTESKVKLMGFDYTLTFRPIDPKEECGGYCDCRNMEIVVDSNYPHQLQQEILIHELIEQLDSAFELDLDHWKIQALGRGLMQAITDNPPIRHKLLEEIIL